MEKKDVVRGQINTVILSSLYDGEKYGYEIRKQIELKTSGKFILKEPTLYSSLKRLEKSGFVESYWGDIEDTNGGRRRYYRLTEKGREICERNLNEWEYSRTLMDKLISDKEVDLATAEPPASSDSEITAKVKRNYIRDIDRNSGAFGEEKEDINENLLSPAESFRDVHKILEENERELADASNVIETGRESFESRIQEIENRVSELETAPQSNLEFETTPESAKTVEQETELREEISAIDFGNSNLQNSAELSTENAELPADSSLAENIVAETSVQETASTWTTENIPPQEPEVLHTVKDYSSFQITTYETEDPKFSEQINRYLQETKEKRAEQDDRDYKNRLGKLLSSAKTFTSAPEEVPQTENDEKVISFETAAAKAESRRNDPLENEDLKALSSKIQAEGFKIKAYHSENSKDYKTFLLKNKINFVAALILFAAFALEVLLFFLITEPYTKRGFGIYGIFIGCAALVPLVAFIAYKLNPERKTKAKFSFRDSFINCVLIFAYAFLVVMALNLIFKVQFANVAEIILKIFLPSLVAFQLVIGCLVYAALYHGNRFHA